MDLLTLLETCGALRPGPTLFRNGLAADGWVKKGHVMRRPALLRRVAQMQAAQLQSAFPHATLLVGAPACGAVLASRVAEELDLSVAYVLTGEELEWHRMHRPDPGERVVYVDDLICTGSDARRVLAFLRAEGHEVCGVSAWVSHAALEPERLVTLTEPPFRTFEVGGGEAQAALGHLPVRWRGVRE